MYKDPQIKNFKNLNSTIEKFSEKLNKNFDQFVTDCDIDINKNRSLSDEYYNHLASTKKIQKKIKRLKIWRWILIIFLLFPFFIINKKIKVLNETLNDSNKILEEKKAELDKQLSKLLSLISIRELFVKSLSECWDDVKFLSSSNFEYFAQMENEYLSQAPDQSYTQNLIVGQLFEHPFGLFNQKSQIWYDHVYTAFRTIPYTTHFNGHTQTNFETVTAVFPFPAPKWLVDTKLIYKSSFAPNLYFTTNCSKKEFKKWDKSKQTALENNKFNKICKIIRNDEKDIRVVFTPLAQEQFVELFESQEYWITKNKNLTTIDLPQNNYCLNNQIDIKFSYNLEIWKKNINAWATHFIKVLGVFSMPIASMPVYYQMSEHNDSMDSVFSTIQAQSDIDTLLRQAPVHFTSDVIFKPSSYKLIQKNNKKYYSSKIVCNYFEPILKTKLVPTTSIHHGIVTIPVEYFEYVPKTKILYLLQDLNTFNNKYFINEGLLNSFVENDI